MGNHMKKLSLKQRSKELAALATRPEDQIDTSDIPELTEEQFRHAVRGRFYRPMKQSALAPSLEGKELSRKD